MFRLLKTPHPNMPPLKEYTHNAIESMAASLFLPLLCGKIPVRNQKLAPCSFTQDSQQILISIQKRTPKHPKMVFYERIAGKYFHSSTK
jgi:hypothetical protein